MKIPCENACKYGQIQFKDIYKASPFLENLLKPNKSLVLDLDSEENMITYIEKEQNTGKNIKNKQVKRLIKSMNSNEEKTLNWTDVKKDITLIFASIHVTSKHHQQQEEDKYL